jgi:AcrR family transcriptional regulator
MRARKSFEAGTADRIYRAAEELLGERGYDGVSIRDVADRAGVNKALVFYYFKTKSDLFDTVLERYYEAHTAALAKAFEREGSFRERVRRVVDAYVDFMHAHRIFPRLVQGELSRATPRTDKIRKNFAGLLGWMARAMEGALPDRGPTATKHLFLSIAAMVVNYYTYAPAIADLWGEDPFSEHALAERRAHLHWMVDAVLDKLEAEREGARSRGLSRPR